MGIREQSGHDVRLDWGGEGVAALGRECAVLVVVDVLSFGTTTDLVVGRGGRVLPVRWRDERGFALARAAGAVVAGEGAFTLRPSSVTELPPGTLLALPSPNGATLCDAAAATGAQVPAGCLRNASAVAAKAHLVGAGAIAAAPARFGRTLSPEAALAARSVDVAAVARIDVSGTAPVLHEGVLG